MSRKKDEYMVVKSNELIQAASYNLTATEQKFLCYVISRIKPTDKDFERITVSAGDFAQLAGIDRKNIYTEFRKMAEAFNSKARWIKIGDEVQLFQVFYKPSYNSKAGSLSVIMDPDLKRHLLQLGDRYTMYELWNVLSLKSKYAIRLYELFKSYAYQEEIDFEIDNLKSLLCCEGYKRFGDFKERVVLPAVKEINELTNLTVEFSVKRRGVGGKATEMYFTIVQKHSLEAFAAYRRTVDAINKKEKQIPGQMSIFDLGAEDFED